MSDLIKTLLAAAKEVTPLIVPGAAAAIAVGTKVAEALSAAKDLAGDDNDVEQAVLDKTISDLQTTINLHADKTIGDLKG